MINSIERAKILADNEVIHLKNLPSAISESVTKSSTSSTVPSHSQANFGLLQRQHVISVLQASGGNKSKAARSLGVSRRTLYRLLDRHDISLEKSIYEISAS
ncbi:MAG: transcriptional regulator of acetoin/glycerol metabolism [Mariniblastus sp.]